MAGLCPDLLGELTVLHRTPSWIKGCPPPHKGDGKMGGE